MFLLPALFSFAADVIVLIVHYKYYDLLDPQGFWSIENTLYLPSLSIARIVSLIPLNYHVYSGTRLKFPFVYSVWHGITAVIILCHFFAFFALSSENFSDFYVPSLPVQNGGIENAGSGSTVDFDDDDDKNSKDLRNRKSDDTFSHEGYDDPSSLYKETMSDQIKEYDIIWILLTLSLLSIGLHAMILLHVRSTAPSDDALKRKLDGNGTIGNEGTGTSGTWSRSQNGRKRLGYWIYNQYRRGNSLHEGSLSLESNHGSDHSHRSPIFGVSMVMSPLGSPRRSNSDLSVSRASLNSDLESGLSMSSRSQETDPFLSRDIFQRPDVVMADGDENCSQFRRRNRHRAHSGVSLQGLVGIHRCFSTGYDDFMGEIRARFAEAKKEWTLRLDDVKRRINQNENGNAKHILSQFNQNTPFRALLHMYAHEEVFRNNRLDRAFPDDEDLALSFYAPQLLCFLLHNAFLSTGKLERWILDRCKTDVYFAHRCYWFLRAWCLQGGIFIPDEECLMDSPMKRNMSGSALEELRHGLSSSPEEGRAHSEPDFTNIRGLVSAPSKEDLQKSNGIKFPPEERKVLSDLLAKVTECGELAARQLEACLNHVQSSSNPLESSPLGHSFVPIDPGTEFPTMGHYNAAHSKIDPGYLQESNASVRLKHDGEKIISFFLRTPDFLDCLISIADDLLLQPTTNRTPELRNRLKELEFSMLPSNSIYVPVNGCLHRVWRILASESIALSTKERVPCIIYLEVIDHARRANNPADKTLRKWYTSPRPPQRLNTLLYKVTQISQKGLKKLRHDFEENQEKLFSRLNSSIIQSENGDDSEISEDEVADAFAPTRTSCHSSPLMDEDDIVPGNFSSAPSDSSDGEGTPVASSPETDLGQWLNNKVEEKSSKRDSPTIYGSTALPSSDISDSSDQKMPSSATKSNRSQFVVFKEDWAEKEERLRLKSAQGNNPNWRLLPILIKSNDDLRQEQLASQLIQCMAGILANARIPTWLYPYDIVALSFRGGIMEAIPDTISIDSLRKNHPHFTDLRHFFGEHFGQAGSDSYENAKANFVESLAAYSIVCFLLQIKDRHNGNILLDNKGHLIHIDFGFFFLSSPGKNSGFESAPFKLTSEFIGVMDGVKSHTFNKFRELCYKTFIELRKNCFQITLLIQMLMEGNEDLDCFRGRPHDAVQGLQERFRLDLNDRACQDYVNSLINASIGNWTTSCYDRYQRCCVGVM